MRRHIHSAYSMLAIVGHAILGLLFLLAFSQNASAQQSPWIGDSAIAEARLVSAVSGVGDIDIVPLGLEIRMAPGWKVYWRTPGEAGLPPVLDFSLSPSPNLNADMQWPAPKRFNAFGFENFGYEGHVIFPINLTGHIVGGLLQLNVGLEALACADICVPLAGDLALVVPDGRSIPTIHARAIVEYAARVPRLADASGMAASGPNLGIVDATFLDGNVTINMPAGAPPITDAFIEGFDQIAFKAPIQQGDKLRIPYVLSKNAIFSGGSGRITLIASAESGDFPLHIKPENTAPSSAHINAASGLTLWAIAIAFLGGLILNLMPCVLPVLAIKLSSIITVAGDAKTEVRLRFLVGAAGIVTSFLILASALAVLKAGGAAIGWGIQFQNVYFIGGMMVLLGLFTASLLDLVTFKVPSFVQRKNVPAAKDGRTSLGGDFLSGMLATILATPCSAPFVGTAVTIAFSGSVIDLFGIFIAMGLGLASPWLLVALIPATVTVLPKPGPWFKWLRVVLAAMLAGTIIWLGTIFAALIAAPSGDADGSASNISGQWQNWQPSLPSKFVADGKIVFVDVTADWCVTCKANKALVLNQPPISGVLTAAAAADQLVMLQADWTRPSDEITAFLARYDRFGIPFNIIFSPAIPDGIILPELLRTESVLAALEKAGINPK